MKRVIHRYGHGLRVGLGLVTLLFTIKAAHAADIVHIYDDLGRIVATVDGSDAVAGVAVFSYDPTGNVLGIARQSPSQLALIEFAPKCGAPTQVTLWGTGYSATPSQNTVTVGGLAAAVTAATATTLVISVPPGASGALTVTTPSGSTTSSQSFAAGAC